MNGNRYRYEIDEIVSTATFDNPYDVTPATYRVIDMLEVLKERFAEREIDIKNIIENIIIRFIECIDIDMFSSYDRHTNEYADQIKNEVENIITEQVQRILELSDVTARFGFDFVRSPMHFGRVLRIGIAITGYDYVITNFHMNINEELLDDYGSRLHRPSKEEIIDIIRYESEYYQPRFNRERPIEERPVVVKKESISVVPAELFDMEY